jgi:hypothetical protein
MEVQGDTGICRERKAQLHELREKLDPDPNPNPNPSPSPSPNPNQAQLHELMEKLEFLQVMHEVMRS